MKKQFALFLLLAVLLSACSNIFINTNKQTDYLRTPDYLLPKTGGTPVPLVSAPTLTPTLTLTPAVTPTPSNTSAPTLVPTPPKAVKENQVTKGGIPVFEHVIVIMLEYRNYTRVVGRTDLPVINGLLKENVSFTHYYAITHPGLPNYLALLGGDTFGINTDCVNCTLDKPSLPDLLDKAGYTWKTYQENMPAPCSLESTDKYDVNRNPFVYFASVRNNTVRCQRGVVPLSDLDGDLRANVLPNFALIVPDSCNSGRECSMSTSEVWLDQMIKKLTSSPALGNNYMIFFTFDQGDTDYSTCCGLKTGFGGGHIAAGMISPRAKTAFEDPTDLTNYGLLKTILLSWGLPDLGVTGSASNLPVTKAWK